MAENASTVRMFNPHTGGTGEVPIDQLHDAVADGLHPLQSSFKLFNPHTGGEGEVPAAQLHEALSDGLVPSGSHAHKVATSSGFEAAGRGALQGATFGFGDEAIGGVTGALDALSGPETFGDAYRRNRDESRASNALSKEAHPYAYGAGQVGGGLAGALATGGTGAGAGLLGRLGIGAALGAANGLGSSEADLTKGEVGQAAKDTALGGAVGVGTQGLLEGLGNAVGPALKNTVGKFFDPHANRMAAIGANARNMDPIVGRNVHKAVSNLEDQNYFPNMASTPQLLKTVLSDKEELGANIGTMMIRANEIAAQKSAKLAEPLIVDKEGILSSISDETVREAKKTELTNVLDEKELYKMITRAPFPLHASMKAELDYNLGRVQLAQHDLSEMHDLRQDLGNWIGGKFGAENNPVNIQIKQKLWQALRNRINGVVDELGINDPSFQGLRQLNAKYSALETIDNSVARKFGREEANASPLGARYRDAMTGVMLGTATGSGLIGAAATLANKALGGTRGQLARAAIGEQVDRSLTGIRSWVHLNMPRLQATNPQMAQEMAPLLTLPDSKADVLARSLLPYFNGVVKDSIYPSEMDGKLGDPVDIAAHRIDLEGLPLAARAKALSDLNKTGKISYRPPNPSLAFPQAAAPGLGDLAQRMRNSSLGAGMGQPPIAAPGPFKQQ